MGLNVHCLKLSLNKGRNMLDSILTKFTGIVSKKWLIGRRVVLDLTASKERRISVVVVPAEMFSFDLRETVGAFEIVMSSDSGLQVIASFEEEDEALKVLRSIKFSILRPFKKIVMASLGVIIVLFAFDLSVMHRDTKMNTLSGRPNVGTSASQSGLSPAQIAALKEQFVKLNTQAASAAPVQQVVGAPSGVPEVTPAQSSSPEAQAAMRLLQGK